MSDNSFEQLAQVEFARIFEKLDGEDGFDIDLQGGILTIEMEEGGTFVINKHAPSGEIWLSSPVSGAWHFRNIKGDWIATKSPNPKLEVLLYGELTGLLGRQIHLK